MLPFGTEILLLAGLAIVGIALLLFYLMVAKPKAFKKSVFRKEKNPETVITDLETPESPIVAETPETSKTQEVPETQKEVSVEMEVEEPKQELETPEAKIVEEEVSVEVEPPKALKPPRKASARGEKGEAPPECPYRFGYLKELPKNKPIPNECWSCPKLTECLET